VLYSKRLEKGRFVWPQAKDGTLSLTPAQLSMLVEGIDWRQVAWTARPQTHWIEVGTERQGTVPHVLPNAWICEKTVKRRHRFVVAFGHAGAVALFFGELERGLEHVHE
jgi:IS66 Orf2 like protein